MVAVSARAFQWDEPHAFGSISDWRTTCSVIVHSSSPRRFCHAFNWSTRRVSRGFMAEQLRESKSRAQTTRIRPDSTIWHFKIVRKSPVKCLTDLGAEKPGRVSGTEAENSWPPINADQRR